MAINQHAEPQFRLRELLPLGYLYLLLLGIASQSIHYAFLGINIMAYSDLLDVLLSPVVLITDHIAFLLTTVLLPLLLWFYLKYIRRYYAQHKPEVLKSGTNTWHPLDQWMLLTALLLFCAFLGFGVGGGLATQQTLSSSDFDPDHRVVFADGNSAEIMKLGINNSFLFYAVEGHPHVIVSPIDDNVHAISRLSRKASEE
ncbi:hypothetical protein VCB98_11360 [Gammaproteobacteria bacterium AB-CW1]|uniref:Uncharacterized protein n=1 Tax=Natronospira elongata TaxID=3110268 RepID=A0AAP6JGW5_9GAMM|nr:hypothetical protein [Gammaproteobacteria bacterium AB-CW1]